MGLKENIERVLNSEGVFRFGFVWTTEHPIHTVYIGQEKIDKNNLNDFYTWVDSVISECGENTLEGEILKENSSLISIKSKRRSYDPFSSSIELSNAELELSQQQLERMVKDHSGLVIDSYDPISVEFEISEDGFLDYEAIGYKVLQNSLFL
jgi:hypothetical protein